MAVKDRKMKKAIQLQQLQSRSNGDGLHFKFSKLFDREANWEKDELPDILHWIRQGLGLLIGLIWGAIPVVGAIWIVLYLVLSTATIFWYYAYFLKIDDEEYDGHTALLQEGLFASFTLFLLSWILVYSLIHF
ncbi:Rab5-interacting family protein [Zostera marina]|uniref:Rab5-interacting family protein n=1 Tax=Zostera marina TaxID=29655 RepID=A0A0K9P3G6_ZOSMR|nr:Rab5-interacting family protein [Zostera marina]KMZ62977.1 Rab5-interacting family protein [Zostera marina]